MLCDANAPPSALEEHLDQVHSGTRALNDGKEPGGAPETFDLRCAQTSSGAPQEHGPVRARAGAERYAARLDLDAGELVPAADDEVDLGDRSPQPTRDDPPAGPRERAARQPFTGPAELLERGLEEVERESRDEVEEGASGDGRRSPERTRPR